MKRSILIICLAMVLLGSQGVCGAGTTTISQGKELGKFTLSIIEATASKIQLTLKAVINPNSPVGAKLTLLTQAPKGWNYCLVTQKDISQLYPIVTGSIRYEILPESGPIILEKSPGPVISRNAPVFASGESYPAKYANDDDYSKTWWGYVPGWIAYDLSGVPKAQRGKVVIAWYTEGIRDYDHSLVYGEAYNNAGSYTIEANKAAAGKVAPSTGWVTLVTVNENTYHSRQHICDLSGYNWLRMSVTKVDGFIGNNVVSVNLDVHDGARGGLEDDWIFYGDSITAAGMETKPNKAGGGTGTFAQLINAARPNRFPVAEDGGIGGLVSGDGAQHIDLWLSLFPGKYVGLAYGTNDAWRSGDPEEYYQNMKRMVEAVIAAGKVPVIPTIPWSSKEPNIQNGGPILNQKIADLCAAYPQIIPGPDLWSYFKEHPDLLSADGVHPSDAGYVGLRQQWVNTALAAVYKNN